LAVVSLEDVLICSVSANESSSRGDKIPSPSLQGPLKSQFLHRDKIRKKYNKDIKYKKYIE